ncbi:uncharacterized protein LOC130803732 [Amaranthus tricolor]|uniref:uncharacterized protein LOC130803732 n=1 Tax=Amaranthus tricolor TaxID=29722 RepID=UPI0025892493|nr:uncharacterized protein LOC130803732 [Amaranthus tricolor]
MLKLTRGGDAFVVGGFRAWNKSERLEKHVGGIKSAHNIAYEKYVNLRDAKKTSIEFVFDNASEVQMNEYHIRLNASLTCLRFLLGQGLAFRGHDESEESYSRGNFLELLKWLGGKVEEIRKYTFQNANCTWLFDVLANLLNVVGASCKRRDLIRKNQAQVVAQALEVGEIESGSGLNQERGLSRPGDTRWGSHYKCLISIINLFPSIVKVLEEIGENGSPDDKLKAQVVLGSLESFDFIFMAHFMLTIFGYTNDLCVALQRKEQDIVNAISLVQSTTNVLQKMRDQGWDSLLDKVILFCTKHEIDVPSMDAHYVPQGRSRRFAKQATNLHHFGVAIFLEVIDLHLQEIDNRFNEKNMELLTCMASLSPRGNFSSFDKERILKLASLYPVEFSCYDLTALDLQLDVFLDSMQNDERFHDLQDINSLSMMLVKTRRHETFPLIHLLINLMLILPVATASVERVFSAMTFVKNKLRNSMGDQLVNDCLVTYIEKEVFLQVSDEKIIDRFRIMKTRRMNL